MLVKKGLKDFPYRKQPNEYTCGPTCIEMVLEYFGIKYTREQVNKLCQASPKDGTDNRKMSKAIEAFNAKQTTKQDATISELATALDNGQLSIVNYRNPNSGHGHFAVVLGLTEEKIILADPNDGQRRELSAKKFPEIWVNSEGTIKGWMMSVAPPKKINNNL